MDIVGRATGEYHPDVLPDIYEITGTKCQLQDKNLLVFPAGLCNIIYKMLHFGKPPYNIYICGMAQAGKKINFFLKIGVKFCRKAPKYSV